MSQVGKCHRLANVPVGKYPVGKYLVGKSHGDQMTGGKGPGGKMLAGKWVFTVIYHHESYMGKEYINVLSHSSKYINF